MSDAITVMFKLQERHRFIKQLHGDKFDGVVENWIPLFREHAKIAKTTGVLETAISMGKLLADAQGQSDFSQNDGGDR
jgi:hypothetical protein